MIHPKDMRFDLVKIEISLDIRTDETIEEITTALKRGIYHGLDTEPHYIAPPSHIRINHIKERT